MIPTKTSFPANMAQGLGPLLGVLLSKQRLLLLLIKSPAGTKRGGAEVVPASAMQNRLRYTVAGIELHLVLSASCRGRGGRVVMDRVTDTWATNKDRPAPELRAFAEAIMVSIGLQARDILPWNPNR